MNLVIFSMASSVSNTNNVAAIWTDTLMRWSYGFEFSVVYFIHSCFKGKYVYSSLESSAKFLGFILREHTYKNVIRMENA